MKTYREIVIKPTRSRNKL